MARRVGAVVGFGVGLGAGLLALAVLSLDVVLVHPDGPAVAGVASVVGMVGCLTGGAVGWLAGPSGWGDPRQLTNRLLIVRMAIAADLLGAWLAGVGFALAMLPGELSRPPLEITLFPFIIGTVFSMYGIVIFGLPVLPITATAAAAWIYLMDRMRDRFDSHLHRAAE